MVIVLIWKFQQNSSLLIKLMVTLNWFLKNLRDYNENSQTSCFSCDPHEHFQMHSTLNTEQSTLISYVRKAQKIVSEMPLMSYEDMVMLLIWYALVQCSITKNTYIFLIFIMSAPIKWGDILFLTSLSVALLSVASLSVGLSSVHHAFVSALHLYIIWIPGCSLCEISWR